MKTLRPILAVLFAFLILFMFVLNNRKSNQEAETTKIAIFKINSRLLLNQTEEGVMKALEEKGITDADKYTIKHFCAEGDMPTANVIAQSIVNDDYDMVITISTPALQAMANANKEGKVTHVFCAVTDPYIADVGITGPGVNQHPKHLVGIGTFQPVYSAFEIAKELNPQLKKVGTVWCTSELSSEACVILARQKCEELDIELIEMSVINSNQVLDVAMDLTAQGVDALWLGGDNVVETSTDQLVLAANQAKIPLFSNNPYNIYGNTLFGIGAKYSEVGYIAGNMAVEILNGKSTLEIGVKNMVPKNFILNNEAFHNISEEWSIDNLSEKWQQ